MLEQVTTDEFEQSLVTASTPMIHTATRAPAPLN